MFFIRGNHQPKKGPFRVFFDVVSWTLFAGGGITAIFSAFGLVLRFFRIL